MLAGLAAHAGLARARRARSRPRTRASGASTATGVTWTSTSPGPARRRRSRPARACALTADVGPRAAPRLPGPGRPRARHPQGGRERDPGEGRGSRSPRRHAAGRAGVRARDRRAHDDHRGRGRRLPVLDADRRDGADPGLGVDGRQSASGRLLAGRRRARCRRSRPASSGGERHAAGQRLHQRDDRRRRRWRLNIDCQPGDRRGRRRADAGRGRGRVRDRRRSTPARRATRRPALRKPVLTLRTTKLKRTGKRVSVALACADAPCKGTVSLKYAAGRRRKTHLLAGRRARARRSSSRCRARRCKSLKSKSLLREREGHRPRAARRCPRS